MDEKKKCDKYSLHTPVWNGKKFACSACGILFYDQNAFEAQKSKMKRKGVHIALDHMHKLMEQARLALIGVADADTES